MPTMETIRFTYNWNNKLGCNAFTTIRLANDKKYVVGQTYNIQYKKVSFKAFIVSISKFTLDKLTNLVAMLDTGYTLEETKEVIRKMYPDITENQVFYLILLKKVDN